eukprot:COSAG05_NODE_792_length_7316_cov_31.215325_4_plen_270_part_00
MQALAITAAILTLLSCTRCTAGRDSAASCIIWLEDPLSQISPSTPPPSQPLPPPQPIVAARSQVVSMQICVHNPGTADVKGARLGLEGLPESFRLETRLVGFVNTTTLDNLPAGIYPDPLLPISHTRGTTLPAGSTTGFWVDIAVPEDLTESGRLHIFTVELLVGNRGSGGSSSSDRSSGTTTVVSSALRVFNFSVATQSLRTDSSVNGLDAKHWLKEGAPYYPGRSRKEVATAWYTSLTMARVNAMALAPIEVYDACGINRPFSTMHD